VSLGVACFVFGLGVALGGRVEAVELHGRVLDVLHQRGVPGLTVRLTPPRGSHIPEQITMTDAEGGFSFRGLSRGPYLIEVSQALQPLYRQPIELQGDQQLEIELRAKPEPISPPPVSPSGPLPPK
jgi:hypothetical protein